MPEIPTIMLARSRVEAPVRRELESRLTDALAARGGGRLVITAPLYDLDSEGPSVARLRAAGNDLIVLAWMAPRAIFGTLAQHGVEGQLGPITPEDNQEGTGTKEASTERMIWCFDLGQSAEEDEWLQRLEPMLGQRAEPAAPGQVEVLDEETHPRWYPVVDTARCIGCLECFNFCLFGVYGLGEDDRLQVEQPNACRPGCPACARVCPAGAILFPEHADPVISGHSEARPDPMQLDLLPFPSRPASIGQGDAQRDTALAERNACSEKSTEPKKSTTPPQSPSDDLDDLVDQVDDLDL
ncbi:MAG: ferredoxin family protein [Pirellulales bacterium]|nr:ferredoxin family protein [Pirellulales bacterium]